MDEVMLRDAHPDDGDFQPSYVHKFTTAREFADAKIEMLRDEMCINLSIEDIEHLYSLKEEYEINAAVKAIINKHWR